MLSGRAARALAENRRRIGLGSSTGVRISASESGNGSAAGYQVRFASHPSPGDAVFESAGTKVFLAAGLEQPLKTTVLDTVDTPQGEKLVLRPRR
jgi:Fe-S cluster assembly iron-binding protein IscA